MATIVTQARNNTPWWAPLAVNVLGGLWNDWQQNERNKKESALAAEAAKILSPQVTEETPATSLPNMANTGLSDTGLLNMAMATPNGYDDNGWASIFHKNYTPLTQFDLGTAGVTPAMSPSVPATPLGLSNNSGNLSNWANAMRNSDSPLSQFDMGTAGIVPASTAPTQDTTSGTPAPAVTNMGRNTGLPTPLDFYRQYMELKGSKRFGMVGNEASQKILEPLMKLLEATRQEELRNALANEYIAATDTAGRNNTAAGGLLRGTIGSDVFNSIRQANTPTPHFTDLGGAVVPSMFDPWTGQITRGDEWAKSPTPGEAATNAYNWAKLDAEMADKAATRQESARQANMANAYNYWNATGTLGQKTITGNDGSIYQYNPQTNRYEPTDIRGSAAISKFDEQVIKDYDSQLDVINKELNRLAILKRNSETHGYDTKEIDAQIKAQQEKQAQIQQSRTSYIANLQHRNGQGQSTVGNDTSQVGEGLDIGANMLGVNKATITTPYGTPRKKKDGTGYNHNAVDYAMTKDTPIRLDDVGVPMTVTKVANQPDGYGNYVDLEGTLTSADGKSHKIGMRFAHMGDGTVNVAKGQTVRFGDLIGKVGNTGNSRGKNGGYHLHLETTIDGKPVDPTKFKSLIAPYMAYSKTIPSGTFTGIPLGAETQKATLAQRQKETTKAYRNPKTGDELSQAEIERMEQDADNGKLKSAGSREELHEVLREKGYKPVMAGQDISTASADVPVLIQTPPSPISGDLGLSPRTISSDVTPDMAATPSVDPLDYRPAYMRTNLPSAINPIQQSGKIARINPSSSISLTTPAFASTTRSPEMPQPSMQEAANTQQGLAMLNNDEYPYFESDDVGPLYNNPFEDPDYSPIPNIDQPQLPPERRFLRVMNRRNRYPFGIQSNTWRI